MNGGDLVCETLSGNHACQQTSSLAETQYIQARVGGRAGLGGGWLSLQKGVGQWNGVSMREKRGEEESGWIPSGKAGGRYCELPNFA